MLGVAACSRTETHTNVYPCEHPQLPPLLHICIRAHTPLYLFPSVFSFFPVGGKDNNFARFKFTAYSGFSGTGGDPSARVRDFDPRVLAAGLPLVVAFERESIIILLCAVFPGLFYSDYGMCSSTKRAVILCSLWFQPRSTRHKSSTLATYQWVRKMSSPPPPPPRELSSLSLPQLRDLAKDLCDTSIAAEAHKMRTVTCIEHLTNLNQTVVETGGNAVQKLLLRKKK